MATIQFMRALGSTNREKRGKRQQAPARAVNNNNVKVDAPPTFKFADHDGFYRQLMDNLSQGDGEMPHHVQHMAETNEAADRALCIARYLHLVDTSRMTCNTPPDMSWMLGACTPPPGVDGINCIGKGLVDKIVASSAVIYLHLTLGRALVLLHDDVWEKVVEEQSNSGEDTPWILVAGGMTPHHPAVKIDAGSHTAAEARTALATVLEIDCEKPIPYAKVANALIQRTAEGSAGEQDVLEVFKFIGDLAKYGLCDGKTRNTLWEKFLNTNPSRDAIAALADCNEAGDMQQNAKIIMQAFGKLVLGDAPAPQDGPQDATSPKMDMFKRAASGGPIPTNREPHDINDLAAIIRTAQISATCPVRPTLSPKDRVTAIGAAIPFITKADLAAMSNTPNIRNLGPCAFVQQLAYLRRRTPSGEWRPVTPWARRCLLVPSFTPAETALHEPLCVIRNAIAQYQEETGAWDPAALVDILMPMSNLPARPVSDVASAIAAAIKCVINPDHTSDVVQCSRICNAVLAGNVEPFDDVLRYRIVKDSAHYAPDDVRERMCRLAVHERADPRPREVLKHLDRWDSAETITFGRFTDSNLVPAAPFDQLYGYGPVPCPPFSMDRCGPNEVVNIRPVRDHLAKFHPGDVIAAVSDLEFDLPVQRAVLISEKLSTKELLDTLQAAGNGVAVFKPTDANTFFTESTTPPTIYLEAGDNLYRVLSPIFNRNPMLTNTNPIVIATSRLTPPQLMRLAYLKATGCLRTKEGFLQVPSMGIVLTSNIVAIPRGKIQVGFSMPEDVTADSIVSAPDVLTAANDGTLGTVIGGGRVIDCRGCDAKCCLNTIATCAQFRGERKIVISPSNYCGRLTQLIGTADPPAKPVIPPAPPTVEWTADDRHGLDVLPGPIITHACLLNNSAAEREGIVTGRSVIVRGEPGSSKTLSASAPVVGLIQPFVGLNMGRGWGIKTHFLQATPDMSLQNLLGLASTAKEEWEWQWQSIFIMDEVGFTFKSPKLWAGIKVLVNHFRTSPMFDGRKYRPILIGLTTDDLPADHNDMIDVIYRESTTDSSTVDSIVSQFPDILHDTVKGDLTTKGVSRRSVYYALSAIGNYNDNRAVDVYNAVTKPIKTHPMLGHHVKSSTPHAVIKVKNATAPSGVIRDFTNEAAKVGMDAPFVVSILDRPDAGTVIARFLDAMAQNRPVLVFGYSKHLSAVYSLLNCPFETCYAGSKRGKYAMVAVAHGISQQIEIDPRLKIYFVMTTAEYKTCSTDLPHLLDRLDKFNCTKFKDYGEPIGESRPGKTIGFGNFGRLAVDDGRRFMSLAVAKEERPGHILFCTSGQLQLEEPGDTRIVKSLAALDLERYLDPTATIITTTRPAGGQTAFIQCHPAAVADFLNQLIADRATLSEAVDRLLVTPTLGFGPAPTPTQQAFIRCAGTPMFLTALKLAINIDSMMVPTGDSTAIMTKLRDGLTNAIKDTAAFITYCNAGPVETMDVAGIAKYMILAHTAFIGMAAGKKMAGSTPRVLVDVLRSPPLDTTIGRDWHHAIYELTTTGQPSDVGPDIPTYLEAAYSVPRPWMALLPGLIEGVTGTPFVMTFAGLVAAVQADPRVVPLIELTQYIPPSPVTTIEGLLTTLSTLDVVIDAVWSILPSIAPSGSDRALSLSCIAAARKTVPDAAIDCPVDVLIGLLQLVDRLVPVFEAYTSCRPVTIDVGVKVLKAAPTNQDIANHVFRTTLSGSSLAVQTAAAIPLAPEIVQAAHLTFPTHTADIAMPVLEGLPGSAMAVAEAYYIQCAQDYIEKKVPGDAVPKNDQVFQLAVLRLLANSNADLAGRIATDPALTGVTLCNESTMQAVGYQYLPLDGRRQKAVWDAADKTRPSNALTCALVEAFIEDHIPEWEALKASVEDPEAPLPTFLINVREDISTRPRPISILVCKLCGGLKLLSGCGQTYAKMSEENRACGGALNGCEGRLQGDHLAQRGEEQPDFKRIWGVKNTAESHHPERLRGQYTSYTEDKELRAVPTGDYRSAVEMVDPQHPQMGAASKVAMRAIRAVVETIARVVNISDKPQAAAVHIQQLQEELKKAKRTWGIEAVMFIVHGVATLLNETADMKTVADQATREAQVTASLKSGSTSDAAVLKHINDVMLGDSAAVQDAFTGMRVNNANVLKYSIIPSRLPTPVEQTKGDIDAIANLGLLRPISRALTLVNRAITIINKTSYGASDTLETILAGSDVDVTDMCAAWNGLKPILGNMSQKCNHKVLLHEIAPYLPPTILVAGVTVDDKRQNVSIALASLATKINDLTRSSTSPRLIHMMTAFPPVPAEETMRTVMNPGAVARAALAEWPHLATSIVMVRREDGALTSTVSINADDYTAQDPVKNNISASIGRLGHIVPGTMRAALAKAAAHPLDPTARQAYLAGLLDADDSGPAVVARVTNVIAAEMVRLVHGEACLPEKGEEEKVELPGSELQLLYDCSDAWGSRNQNRTARIMDLLGIQR